MRERLGDALCRCGLHRYAPDEEVGYPYQRCRCCEKLGIYRPSSLSLVRRYR